MTPSAKEKYAARLTELDALRHELEAGKRPGDGAVVVGLLLEAAGDVLRRAQTLGASPAPITAAVAAIPELALRSWGDGVQVPQLAQKLKRAASQAVEAALPDSPEAGEAMAQWAVQDLQARDRLESALVALERLGAAGRGDARSLASRLRAAVGEVDRAARRAVVSLTPLNPARRAEAALLDGAFRGQAWWYSERSGIDDDQLVKVLGGEASGSVPEELQRPTAEVNRRRGRPVSFDELLRFDLGLASPAEKEAIRRQADADPELKLSLAAMEAAESAIVAEAGPEAAPVAATPATPERASPQVVEERPEFKVLLFRARRSVQVVVQPQRNDRFAAAAVYRGDAPERALPSSPGELGLHFELGAPEALVGLVARVVVKLVDGQTHACEVRL